MNKLEILFTTELKKALNMKKNQCPNALGSSNFWLDIFCDVCRIYNYFYLVLVSTLLNDIKVSWALDIGFIFGIVPKNHILVSRSGVMLHHNRRLNRCYFIWIFSFLPLRFNVNFVFFEFHLVFGFSSFSFDFHKHIHNFHYTTCTD